MNKFAEQLDAVTEPEITTDGFAIESLADAVEAQSRIAKLRGKQAEIDSLVDARIEALQKDIDRLKDWGEEAKKEFIEKEQFYTHRLEFYLREQIAAGSKKKSIKLPYGAIKMVKQQPEFKRNDRQLLHYAKEKGLVKVKETADWTAIKKQGSIVGNFLVDENGEVIPGVEVHEREDKFTVEVEL
ncbi:host-nuclease inhibitor Gam family protein [Shouchella rhizosphaerae]|uniref:host-nuclease inhibitor Gam family protein n=1 Tax=Shouchella rhizosphaerae TaxID=866786 RepID=UPI003F808C04